MLTDIFADRYSSSPIWSSFEERDRRLLVQAFRIALEQFYPYWDNKGQERPEAKQKWKSIHDKLSMELGVEYLSTHFYSYPDATGRSVTALFTYDYICKNFVLAPYDNTDPDSFIKRRISFIELIFREKGEDVERARIKMEAEIKNDALVKFGQLTTGIKLPGDYVDGQRAIQATRVGQFNNAVIELNTRFKQAGYKLNYHNGFIQLSEDVLINEQIETPFWNLVVDPVWKNVDMDMKEAIDLRDTGGRDPAFYAARALESTIKIISDGKGLTTGKEKGAYNYIDNLGGKRGGNFVAVWEANSLKDFFSNIRNPLTHGPGSADMPALTAQQTAWAIEFCMSWIRSLVHRP
ncbi:AbiJ-NTD4 domain-containing protein [Mesorhizobium shangrilense]|uniref:AbiJ-NTD4 domain-containing protein n=1 Tax=Mesorhizobium shangrilense TaxID=460060 RepID=A0ABV2DBB9_9HYPH